MSFYWHWLKKCRRVFLLEFKFSLLVFVLVSEWIVYLKGAWVYAVYCDYSWQHILHCKSTMLLAMLKRLKVSNEFEYWSIYFEINRKTNKLCICDNFYLYILQSVQLAVYTVHLKKRNMLKSRAYIQSLKACFNIKQVHVLYMKNLVHIAINISFIFCYCHLHRLR